MKRVRYAAPRSELMVKEFLHECFHCDPDVGTLTWKVRPREHFRTQKGMNIFNVKYSGKLVGSNSWAKGGIKKISMLQINGTSLFFGRVMWTMHHGPIPDKMQIDHINGDPWDNRLSNLRLATNQENCFNRGLRRASKSGLKGVSWSNDRKMWYAQIKCGGLNRGLGFFHDPEVAHAAYCAAAKKYHGVFARTK